jgi:hypothetical protein
MMRQSREREGTVTSEKHGRSRRRAKWVLFGVSLLSVPVPYFMVVVGGMVPTAAIIALAAYGSIVFLTKLALEGVWMLGILWAHVALFGGILYALSAAVTWVVFRFFPAGVSTAFVAVLAAVLLLASTFEIYRQPGHNSAPPADLFGILKGFL